MSSLALEPPHDAAVPAAEASDWEACTQWRQTASGERMATSQLQLFGMHCAACAGLIEGALGRVDGVQRVAVQPSIERAEVVWDPARTSPGALLDALRRAGYRGVPDTADATQAERGRELKRSLWRFFVAGFCMMQVMMYTTPTYVASPGEIPPDLLRLLQWACWLLSVPVVLFSAGPFFTAAWRDLRLGRIGMDVPVAIGVAVTFVVSTGATFEPGGLFGHEVYFDSLTMFVAFLLGGRYLELRARQKVVAQLEAGAQRLPDTARRVDAEGRLTRLPAARLRPGDRVQVAVGETVPADGVLLEGRTSVDESLLSGESVPVAKGVDDELVGGSVNLSGPIVLRVTRAGADTRQAQIVALMRQAFVDRPPLVRAVDRIAAPFLWAVLALAAAAALAWSFIDPSRAVWVAVSVLIVTCPCALSLAAPSALLVAAGTLARQGVLLRRLEGLEALAAVDTLMLDKTGTLTEDRHAVLSVQTAEGRRWSPGETPPTPEAADAWRVAGLLAARSAHPLSRALRDAVAVEVDASMPGWSDVAEVPGRGVEALDAGGRRWRLGAADWAGARPAGADDGDAGVQLSVDGKVRLVVAYGTRLRADAPAAIERLRGAGLALRIVSGDRPARVRALADALGIDGQGGARPEDKLTAMAAAQSAGHRVAMVGDGINDAPVLARADFSFAMGRGAALARLQSDAVLLGDRLVDIDRARQLARRTMRVIRQSFAWSAFYNVACIPLALVGWLPPWAAGLGMASSSLLVLLNALRLGRQPAAAGAA